MTRRFRTSHNIIAGRYVAQDMDLSRDRPVMLGGYSYPLPIRNGQTDDLPGYPMEERSRCYVRNHRTHSTVNGVCLDCLRLRGKHR